MGKIIYLNQFSDTDDSDMTTANASGTNSDSAVDDDLLRSIYAAALQSVHPKLSGAFFSTLTLSEDTAREVFEHIAAETSQPMLRQWAQANLQMLDSTGSNDGDHPPDGRKPVVARLISMIDSS